MMGNIVNKAQKYLLNNNCGDLILNDHRTTKPEDRIYASDIMMMFLESERGQNTVKDMKEHILKIAQYLEQGTISEIEARTLLLGLCGVVCM